MRLLIVEDDADLRDALVRRLARDGHLVACAADAIGALAHARTHRPDVVLLDLALPGGSGLVVAARLLRLPEAVGVGIIVITASADPAHAREVARRGWVLLRKPFTLGALRAAIAGAAQAGTAPAGTGGMGPPRRGRPGR